MIDARQKLADDIDTALRDHYHYLGRDITIDDDVTTSGCPVLRIKVNDQTFNVTITRARS